MKMNALPVTTTVTPTLSATTLSEGFLAHATPGLLGMDWYAMVGDAIVR